MTPLIQVPHTTSSLAHTTAGDLSRLTSTLTGTTTLRALVQAEQAAARAMDNLRAMRAAIRVMKREVRG